MIEEQFVSFETAKMLKEAGFDEVCRSAYYATGHSAVMHERNSMLSPGYASRPTQALAARWLREEHNIFIQLNPTFDGWLLDLFDLKKHQYILTNKDANADSYEQALEDGLQEAIKLIKK